LVLNALVLLGLLAFRGYAQEFVLAQDPDMIAAAVVQVTDPEQHTVELLHVSGKSFHPRLAQTIADLKERGFSVQATLVTQDAFDQIELGARSDPGFSTFLVDTRVAHGFQRIKGRIFNAPTGLTFFRHFRGLFKNVSRDQWKATAEALIVANPILQFAISSIGEVGSGDVGRLGPSILMSSWIVAYILNIRQIASFKGQRKVLQEYPNAPAGQQIRVHSSSGFMFATTLVQELIFNCLLTLTIFQVSDLSPAILINALVNVPLSTFARTPFESRVSETFAEESEARARGEFQLADALHKRGVWIERVSSNYLIPALKLLALVAPAVATQDAPLLESVLIHASWFGLVLMGGMGGVMKLKAAIALKRKSAKNDPSAKASAHRTLIRILCTQVVDTKA
jgi:hypothetical protein